MTSADEHAAPAVRVTRDLVRAPDLAGVRRRITEAAGRVGLQHDDAARFTLAVNEIATNAIQHGGGAATVAITTGEGRIVVEVSDNGSGIPGSVSGELPSPDQLHGRGLWLARQLCDDVTVDSAGRGTIVRLSATANQR